MKPPADGRAPLVRLTSELATRLGGDPDSSQREVTLLIAHVSGVPVADLLMHRREPAGDILSASAMQNLEQMVDRRVSGVPLAYITGQREFYSRVFHVGPGCLVPRPESEHLVELSRTFLDGCPRARVVDCCTGSGCVGISIAAERQAAGEETVLVMSDVSADALAWADRNARTILGESDTWSLKQAHLLSDCPVQGSVDLVVANPPYLSPEETQAALSQGWGEPATALNGGADGLSLYPELARQAMTVLRPGGHLIVEHGAGQGSRIRSMFQEAGLVEIVQHYDLAGHDRNVSARRSEE